jgi:hypothetical protein
MMKDILKVAFYSIAGIFYKRLNKKARDIIITWDRDRLKKNFIYISIFYIVFTSIFLYMLSEFM